METLSTHEEDEFRAQRNYNSYQRRKVKEALETLPVFQSEKNIWGFSGLLLKAAQKEAKDHSSVLKAIEESKKCERFWEIEDPAGAYGYILTVLRSEDIADDKDLI